MAARPVVSVIVPAKNEEVLLPQCLDALTHQDTKIPYEIIVVDSNSRDNTPRIAKKAGVRYINEPKKGKIYGFIRGVSEARGSILCFTEADCVVPASWIGTIVGYFEKNPSVAAISGGYTFHKAAAHENILVRISLGITHFLSLLWYRNATFRCSNSAIRKAVYDTIGGFNINFHELYDTDLGKRAGRVGAVHHVEAMEIKNSDRRVRGRFWQYLTELIPTVIQVVLLERPLRKQSYKDIR
ncbi:glycosyltransferase family 2 protein [Candidatus Gottesmanbacteria bacterium]|nr:glycosyltransferase family 2 protein [Candidatus Gottesmanbacteria bacterium]